MQRQADQRATKAFVQVTEDEYEASSSKTSECYILILSQFGIDLSLIVFTRIWQPLERIWIILPFRGRYWATWWTCGQWNWFEC